MLLFNGSKPSSSSSCSPFVSFVDGTGASLRSFPQRSDISQAPLASSIHCRPLPMLPLITPPTFVVPPPPVCLRLRSHRTLLVHLIWLVVVSPLTSRYASMRMTASFSSCHCLPSVAASISRCAAASQSRRRLPACAHASHRAAASLRTPAPVPLVRLVVATPLVTPHFPSTGISESRHGRRRGRRSPPGDARRQSLHR